MYVNIPETIPVVAVLIILSIWYFIFWSIGLSFSKTLRKYNDINKSYENTFNHNI